MMEETESILHETHITPEKWERLKAFFGFQKDDEDILREFRLVALTHIDDVIEDLYQWFFKFQEVKAYFPDKKTVRHVKKLQREHFLTLTGGAYGIDYVNQRLKVGITHKRIGLPPNLYMGAYSFYMQAMLPRVLGGFEYDRVKQARAATALVKLIALDQALVLGAYFDQNGGHAENVTAQSTASC